MEPKYQQHPVQHSALTQQPNLQQRNIESQNLSQHTFSPQMQIGRVNIRNASRISVGGTHYSVSQSTSLTTYKDRLYSSACIFGENVGWRLTKMKKLLAVLCLSAFVTAIVAPVFSTDANAVQGKSYLPKCKGKKC